MIATDINAERAIILVDGNPAIVADKDYKMVSLATEALSGRIMVPNPAGGDPIQIVDHTWLLSLAASLCSAAHDRMIAMDAARSIG